MHFDELIGHLGQHTVDGLAKGAIYALIALGYTLVYGVLRLINFAHSEVFMVGTFARCWACGPRFGLRPEQSAGIGMVAAVPAARPDRRGARLRRHGAGGRADRLPAAAPARTRRR